MRLYALACLVALSACAAPPQVPPAAAPETAPPYDSLQQFGRSVVTKDVPYVPTSQETVNEMLRMASVSRNDLVYDLGSGDGRIVITAAKTHGARGVGIDIDPDRIREANENAGAAGVTNRVRFIEGNLFDADLRDATAVTLYLLPEVNIRLRPKLLAELRPGTPVVSHDFDMNEWKPDEQKSVGADELFLWIIPANVNGRWTLTEPGVQQRTAVFRQQFQKVDGHLETADGDLAVANARLRGEEVTFEAAGARYRGHVHGDTIAGTAESGERRWRWSARRVQAAAGARPLDRATERGEIHARRRRM